MVEITVDVSDTDELTIITESQSVMLDFDGGDVEMPEWATESPESEPHGFADQVEHSVEPGDFYIDDYEPTPSPEVNTVEVVELVDARADEFTPPDCDKHVSEFENNRFYPDDDPVVKGRYPNMNDDRVWHFPESRLR